jgi:hypothetical protein
MATTTTTSELENSNFQVVVQSATPEKDDTMEDKTDTKVTVIEPEPFPKDTSSKKKKGKEASSPPLEEAYLDIVQLVSILLIPSFAALAQQDVRAASSHHNGGGDGDDNSNNNNDDVPHTFVGDAQAFIEDTQIYANQLLQEAAGVFMQSPDVTLQQAGAAVYSTFNAADAPPLPDVWGTTVANLNGILRNTSSTGMYNNTNVSYINPDSIRALLEHVGEIERAEDEALINDMVALAREASDEQGLLTPAVLRHVCSSDLSVWQVNKERSLSSFLQDVFETEDLKEICSLPTVAAAAPTIQSKVVTTVDDDDEEDGLHKCSKQANISIDSPPPRIQREIANVDFVLDSHTSLLAVVLLWVFYFLTYVLCVYMSRFIIFA